MEALAAVFVGAGLPMRMRRFSLPGLRDGEALVRVRLTTLCGSDLHTADGRRSSPLPAILGHEILGTVQDIPAGTRLVDLKGHSIRVGDRVIWSMMVSCGQCFFCTHGLPQKCEALFKYGHEAITSDHALSGGLATHCHLKRGTHLLRVPDVLPDCVACPAGCATATIAAALRHAGDLKDGVVLILGAGMLGLTAAAWAATRGARAIVLVDQRVDRLQMGRRFGATHDWIPEELAQGVTALTQGRGADVTLELSGASAAAAASIDLLRIGGRAVWVGAVYPGKPITVTAELVVRRHLTIHGVHNYEPNDLAAAIDFLTANHERFPFAELVSEPYPLSEIEAAMQCARQGTVFRVAIAG
jgi:alcohol dehydrogenase